VSDIDRIEHYLTNLQGLSMHIYRGGKWRITCVQQLNLHENMQVETLQ